MEAGTLFGTSVLIQAKPRWKEEMPGDEIHKMQWLKVQGEGSVRQDSQFFSLGAIHCSRNHSKSSWAVPEIKNFWRKGWILGSIQ